MAQPDYKMKGEIHAGRITDIEKKMMKRYAMGIRGGRLAKEDEARRRMLRSMAEGFARGAMGHEENPYERDRRSMEETSRNAGRYRSVRRGVREI